MLFRLATPALFYSVTVTPTPREYVPVTRVAPRRLSRLAAIVPRVVPPPPQPTEEPRPSPRVGAAGPPAGRATITRSRNPNFRAVTQEAMLSCLATNQMNLSPASLAGSRYPVEMINAVLNKETG